MSSCYFPQRILIFSQTYDGQKSWRMFHACFNGESLQMIPIEHLHTTKLKIHPGWRLQPKPQCQITDRPKNHELCKPYMSQKMHLNQMFKSLWMFQESSSLAFCFSSLFLFQPYFMHMHKKKSWTNPNKTKTNGWSWQPNPVEKTARPEKAWEVGRTHQASDFEFIAEKKTNGESPPNKSWINISHRIHGTGIFTYI